jgi:hypothetical protein
MGFPCRRLVWESQHPACVVHMDYQLLPRPGRDNRVDARERHELLAPRHECVPDGWVGGHEGRADACHGNDPGGLCLAERCQSGRVAPDCCRQARPGQHDVSHVTSPSGLKLAQANESAT